MKIRHILLTLTAMVALSACAQTQFSALEQQQISIEDPTLFEKSDAFTIDFASGRDKDYSFPLPVGKAKLMSDYNVEIETTTETQSRKFNILVKQYGKKEYIAVKGVR